MKQRWRFSKIPKLKKGEKVIIHTHRYAELYKGKVFTVMFDEMKWDSERIVFLKELGQYGKSFWRKFCTRVNE